MFMFLQGICQTTRACWFLRVFRPLFMNMSQITVFMPCLLIQRAWQESRQESKLSAMNVCCTLIRKARVFP